MSDRYLKHIRIDSFGSFFNRSTGPFSPNLNVVYGKNEAGKTTISQFVSGVLFGWDDARGGRNVYKPINSKRSGALFFADKQTGKDEVELSRVKNVDGLQGATEVVEDIDKDTFQTMFALDSDELRSLRNTTDMTARLLTAGSGTQASPAEALANVNERIQSFTSRSASVEHSIVRLNAELKETRDAIQQASEQTERYKAEGREYKELAQQREGLLDRIAVLNEEIDVLVAQKAQLGKVEEQYDSLKKQLDAIRVDAARYEMESLSNAGIDESLLGLDPSEDRAIRDKLEEFSAEKERVAHSVEVARDNQTTSQAAYDALVELAKSQDHAKKQASQRRLQIALSVALPLIFEVIGVLLFMHGREINSLSFTALGIGLVVFGILLAAGALVLIFKPNRTQDEMDQRLQDAQWVMYQDKKKLEGTLANQQALSARIGDWLDSVGLKGANGSIRAARSMLDEAKDQRANRTLADQRAVSYDMRIQSIESNLADLEIQRARIVHDAGFPEGSAIAAFESALNRKTSQRNALLEASERINLRYGELGQQLEQAKLTHSFDEAKQRYQDLRTRLQDSKEQLARLLLARRMLETAISAWESHSQPEVYALASELLSLMTDGEWVRVSMTPEGRLVATDAVHNVREPRLMSLGTCQQLYLALRIALLMHADNVGRSVPILADDILVNFDEDRRIGAAKALARLAEKRQVILFTCHKEVVDAMRSVDERCCAIEL